MKLIVDNGDFSKNDYQKIIHHWNNTKRNYSSNKTLAELFEEQACRTPDQIAVVYQDEHLTYQTLNQASNQLARKIQENYRHRHLKITPDTLIALCLNRRLELFIGMLAILKTGAAYVPIDTNTPPDRLRFMLQDTDSQLLLTQQNLFHQILQSAPEHTQLLTLDTINYQFEERCNLGVNATPSSLAYVIYTSGTTGLPKGVMITHRNIINYYANVSHYFDDLENVDFSTSIAFDLSVTTTLIPLLCGKKIIIYPGDLREIEKYIAHLQQKNIHFIKSTPSFLTQAFSLPQLTKIKICFVGGEKLLSTQLHCLLKNCDTVYDEYGPTENTVGTLLIQKTAELPYDSIIGKPYANHKVYVLNEKKQPVSIGVIGELYVSGAGVARGYLNQPALTAERFTLNPFTQESETMYKTGDLVRWLPDGNLEYISRNDLQVKINGYRIELNEIEYALSRFSAILQNVVLAYENSLIAHYLSKKAINQDELISHLKCWLPDYMLPQQYIHVTAFPLTVNGKVDRDALLQQPIKLNNACILAPRTALEKKLCTAWKEILGVESIGILDDFFRLGGDSIKCMQVMAHLLRDGINCRVRDIFTHRCIAQLSSVLRKNKAIVAESGVLNGDINLLPVQSWFFEQSFSSINHFNQSFLVRVPVLSVARLNAVLPQLIAHHDMLRTCFPCEKNSFRKQKYDVKKFPTEIRDFDIADATHELFTQWQSTFDIENGPLWKIAYITGYSDGSARLYFAFHHLIIDTVSWRILIDDIKRLYAGDKLTDKGSSYRQWVNVIHQYTQKYPEEYRFWENQLLENVSTTLSETAYYASFTLQAELTQQLIGPANKAYHTEINDLLLTALAQSLSDYFGKSSHCITLEGHGREEIDDNLDITRTLGWFTSMYPVILTAKENTTASILFLKEYLRSIPNKGIGYGAFKYTNVLNSRLSDLPKINFNYLGQFDNTSGYWQVVREFSGETVNANNKRPHIFDITGSVINESLHIIISTFLSKESGEIFSLLFEKKLIALANHCMSAVNDECELFTLSDFKSIKISPQLLDNLQKKDRKIEAVYPANSLQQGFIYHAISQPQNDAYRIQFLMDYYSPLDIEVYKNAWIFTIKKNPILRTYFNWDESFIQIVNTQGNFYFQ
ncbi:MAG: amino acid adenylation domain-containing protein, partial [Gammaproteobacteria bacterium]|nr:amino acid adenylation domain-containing protein [Gammaproteobacteria bacterium]